MNWKKEGNLLVLLALAFGVAYFLPTENARFQGAVLEGFNLLKEYAREHVVLCLIPALFIAGAISVFVSKESVLKYLGAGANKVLAYGVASVSGALLAVCSCTVLPLFAGIYGMGAGIGPATAFLYSGPAINVLAIVLTARVLGVEIGIARALGAILFAVVIGLLMHLIFHRSEAERMESFGSQEFPRRKKRLSQDALFIGVLVAVLLSGTWAKSGDGSSLWNAIYSVKWILASLFGIILGVLVVRWLRVNFWLVLLTGLVTALTAVLFPSEPKAVYLVAVVGLSVALLKSGGEAEEWFNATWLLAKQILPLLLIGVLVAGFFFGRPAHEGILPSEWVMRLVGENSLIANFLASIIGAVMYFATLTEVPILQGLMGSGMNKGPALALLLAGPALSLPSMLVINSVLGTKKTLAYISLVVVMATATGMIFGRFF